MSITAEIPLGAFLENTSLINLAKICENIWCSSFQEKKI